VQLSLQVLGRTVVRHLAALRVHVGRHSILPPFLHLRRRQRQTSHQIQAAAQKVRKRNFVHRNGSTTEKQIMWDEIGVRLMQALATAAAERLGPQHALVAACRAADLQSARALLDCLDRADGDAILAAAHKQLREDDAGVLAQWRPGPRPAH
jgi:hypothetical protein